MYTHSYAIQYVFHKYIIGSNISRSREQQLFFHFYAFLVDIPAAGNLVCFLDHVAHVLLHGL